MTTNEPENDDIVSGEPGWEGPAHPDATHDAGHDQDADPPTPDGREPDTSQLDPDSEPASDPDPAPGE